ncbi:MAG: GNAT family N-acetyltransferase [Thermotogae bacterium]|nr:GNAT family N-acetyltransferase [Thermotogota bacterium]
MKVVKLTPELLDSFQRLFVDFFYELRRSQGWSPHAVGEYMEAAARYFQRGDIILIAVDGKEAVGFIRISSREGTFWVEEIYVKPEYRGRGLGRKLVKMAEEEVLKHEISLYLYVLPQDKRAIGFWKSLGYDRINMIELVRDLKPTQRNSETYTVEFLGERFEIFRWKEEYFSPDELEFMKLLREFYKRGGKKEDLLRLFNRALKSILKR